MTVENYYKSKTLAIRLVFLAALVLLAAAFFLPAVRVLEIRAVNGKATNGRGLAKIRSRRAALYGFCISYTHSVNKGRVHDYYRINGDSIQLYKTEFKSYGAGMPEREENPGAEFHADFLADGEAFAMSVERNLGKNFRLVIGVTAAHSVAFFGADCELGEEVFLEKIFPPQTSIEFHIKKISVAKYFLKYFLRRKK